MKVKYKAKIRINILLSTKEKKIERSKADEIKQIFHKQEND